MNVGKLSGFFLLDKKVLEEAIHQFETNIDKISGEKTAAEILKHYVQVEEMAWARFVCNVEGNAGHYRDEWQVFISHLYFLNMK